MRYQITVVTEIDDVTRRFATAEQIKDDIAQLAILKRWAFADKLRVTVEQVDDESQQQGD